METIMQKEIIEQPVAAAKTLEYLRENQDELLGFFSDSNKKILFIARGTSDNVANYGIFGFPIFLGRQSYSLSPSLLNNYSVNMDLSDSLVISISQSGETNEIVDATKKAINLGAKVLAITNSGNSTLAQIANVSVVTPAGKELAVPATKSYTSALIVIAWLIANLSRSPELVQLVDQVPELLTKQLELVSVGDEIINLLAASETAVFASRGLAMGAAFEAALKLKETCGINSSGLSVADLVHGPIAALSSEVPLIVLSADRKSVIYSGLIDLMARAIKLNAPIVTLGDFFPEDQAQHHIGTELGSGFEFIAPIVLAAPGQLLANRVSLARGLNPDSPIGLNKVTKTA